MHSDTNRCPPPDDCDSDACVPADGLTSDELAWSYFCQCEYDLARNYLREFWAQQAAGVIAASDERVLRMQRLEEHLNREAARERS